MTALLIGIDDTDNDHSPGTGHLARDLLEACVTRGLRAQGVTRHQFLVDARIPYTSHNSGACLRVEAEGGIGAVRFAVDWIAERAAEGSDPGVCLAADAQVDGTLHAFGVAASERVLTVRDAFTVMRGSGVSLYGVGGDCQGVIGALAAVGQSHAGNRGRFIAWPGLRDLRGRVSAAAFDRLGITLDHQGNDRYPAADDMYETGDWVRPRLQSGRPVWPVTWSDTQHVWLPIDRRQRHAEA